MEVREDELRSQVDNLIAFAGVFAVRALYQLVNGG